MKKLSVLAFSLLAWVASAAAAQPARAISHLIYQGEPRIRVTDVQYGLYAPKNRAWVEIITYDSEQGGIPYGKPYGKTRTKVPGLNYDVQAGIILVKTRSANIPCAHTVQNGRTLMIRPTGACTFRTVKGLRTIDDGFDGISTERVTEVYMDVAE